MYVRVRVETRENGRGGVYSFDIVSSAKTNRRLPPDLLRKHAPPPDGRGFVIEVSGRTDATRFTLVSNQQRLCFHPQRRVRTDLI